MKNIFLALVLMSAFLPQMSFGAIDPALLKQQDDDSRAFFAQQAMERGQFIQAHREMIDRQDRRARAKREGRTPTDQWTAQDQSTMDAFVQKQESDKEAFLAKQAQDRQSAGSQ